MKCTTTGPPLLQPLCRPEALPTVLHHPDRGQGRGGLNQPPQALPDTCHRGGATQHTWMAPGVWPAVGVTSPVTSPALPKHPQLSQSLVRTTCQIWQILLSPLERVGCGEGPPTAPFTSLGLGSLGVNRTLGWSDFCET